jgi:hypothetical protein
MNRGRSIFTTDRRWFLRSICSLPILSLGGCEAAAPCPLCGGQLSTVGSHTDIRFLPSVNLAVWDRSSDHVGCTGYEPWAESDTKAADPPGTVTCGPEFIGPSPFCTRCFHAYSERDQHWKRVMNSADSFALPLSQEILHIPLPSKEFLLYRLVYEQTFGGRSGKDSYSDKIGFWYKTSAPPSTEANIREYVQRHDMSFGPFPHHDPEQIWVDVIYSGSRPKLAKSHTT